ncbi:hypothetical protein IWQ60_008597 [Tieghemiomyces parasiticus]|uniref:Myb-like domain-containing protein n=1 Tax=Tieghemiomyces parasiticus TaxID=78921 RepID=A0A9W7ZX20_9FUNG|nr:hypothetical protein IWQ60_008597 [Tieghemiomyces parasiticus]
MSARVGPAVDTSSDSPPSSPSNQDGLSPVGPTPHRRVVRDVNWRDTETFELLRIKRQVAEESQRSRFNSSLWGQVAQRMEVAGYQRSPYQCITRWRRLVQRFHELQRTYHANPHQVPTWLYYAEMEAQTEGGSGAGGSGYNSDRRDVLPPYTNRPRGGSLSIPPVSPTVPAAGGVATQFAAHNAHPPRPSSAAGHAIRSPPMGRRIARESTNPYTLPVTPDDGGHYLRHEESLCDNPDEGGAHTLTTLRRRHRGSFSAHRSPNLLPSIGTLPGYAAPSIHPQQLSSPIRTGPGVTTNGGPPIYPLTAPPSQAGTPRHARHHSATSALPSHQPPVVGFPGQPPPIYEEASPTDGPRTAPLYLGDPTNRHALRHPYSATLPPPPHHHLPPHHASATVSPSTARPPPNLWEALKESLDAIRANTSTMNHLQERLMQELSSQRAEYNQIRQETRQDFNQYIEELRQERAHCHNVVTESQERYLRVIRELCLDVSRRLTTPSASPAVTGVNPCASPAVKDCDQSMDQS